jgi:hypothetical protein
MENVLIAKMVNGGVSKIMSVKAAQQERLLISIKNHVSLLRAFHISLS